MGRERLCVSWAELIDGELEESALLREKSSRNGCSGVSQIEEQVLPRQAACFPHRFRPAFRALFTWGMEGVNV